MYTGSYKLLRKKKTTKGRNGPKMGQIIQKKYTYESSTIAKYILFNIVFKSKKKFNNTLWKELYSYIIGRSVNCYMLFKGIAISKLEMCRNKLILKLHK